MKKILALLPTVAFLFIVGLPANATERLGYCNFSPAGANGQAYGDVIINSNCVIYESVNGVAAGNLTFQNAAITLNSELVFAPGKQINIGTGTTLYINTGGKITQSFLCVKDADGDGYADLTSLGTDPASGLPLETPITQIGKRSATIGATTCSTGYTKSEDMQNLTLVDTDPTTNSATKYATSDRELLRLGFTINGVTDAAAAVGDINIVDKNLLVCTSGACPTVDFSSTTGNIYTAGKIGIGKTNPASTLDVTGTINATTSVTAPTFSGALSGNATTATTLQTARTIWGQSFNGSANVSGALSGATTGSFSSTVTAPTFSGSLTGHASLDVAKTGDTMSGRLNFGSETTTPYSAGSGLSSGISFNGWEGSSLRTYGIFTELEDVGGNYSKLTLNWHTGIRIGAYYGYGGIRFYNNYAPTGSMVFSVAQGDSNVRVTNDLWVGSAGRWMSNTAAASHTHDYATHISGYGTNVVDFAKRLFRSDGGDPYNVQTYWTGSRWRLRGYYNDTYHAEAEVAYADSAGSAPANGGTSTYSTYLWSTSHPGSYYLYNYWTGSYWYLRSNHGSGVQVAYADNAGYASSAGSAPANGGTSTSFSGGTGTTAVNGDSYVYLWGNLITYQGRSDWGIDISATWGGASSGRVTIGGGNTYNTVLDVYGPAYATSWNAHSDIRDKENIRPIVDPLKKLLLLRGVNFDWTDKIYNNNQYTKKESIGFIAQEFEKVIPELVFTDKEGYKSIAYSNLLGVVVEGIKEQQKELDSHGEKLNELSDKADKQQQTIDSQQKQIEDLKKSIEEMKNNK